MKDRDRIDEILAGGYLPARTYDDIFERVVETSHAHTPGRADGKPRRASRRWRWLLLVPAGTLATALGVLLVLPRTDGGRFRVKGASTAMAATGIALACKTSGGPRCRPGDTLMFLVSPSAAAGYLAAYAQRVDDPTGERIRYFPDRAGESPRVQPASGTTVLGEGVTIGPEHRPGRYHVTLWLTPDAVALDATEPAPASDLSTTVDLEMLP